jgi:hypothetical protein
LSGIPTSEPSSHAARPAVKGLNLTAVRAPAERPDKSLTPLTLDSPWTRRRRRKEDLDAQEKHQGG